MTFVVVLIFTIIPEVTNLKKSKMLYNWPKLLVVTQIVRFGSHYLEIRSDVSSFSAVKSFFNTHKLTYYLGNIFRFFHFFKKETKIQSKNGIN